MQGAHPQPSGAESREATSALLRHRPRGLNAAVLAAAARRPVIVAPK